MVPEAQADGDAPRWVRWMARAGYLSRGVIYLLVGLLAALAVHSTTAPKGTKGALQKLFEQPLGDVLLLILIAGLLAYALWRFVQSLMDTDDHGLDARGLVVRLGLFISGVTHIGLAIAGITILSTGSGEQGSSDLSRRLMQLPFGAYLVGLTGAWIIGAGVAHLIKAIKEQYREWLNVPEPWMDRLNPLFKIALAIRGIVFGLIGTFFIFAALQHDPQHAKGLSETLKTPIGCMAQLDGKRWSSRARHARCAWKGSIRRCSRFGPAHDRTRDFASRRPLRGVSPFLISAVLGCAVLHDLRNADRVGRGRLASLRPDARSVRSRPRRAAEGCSE